MIHNDGWFGCKRTCDWFYHGLAETHGAGSGGQFRKEVDIPEKTLMIDIQSVVLSCKQSASSLVLKQIMKQQDEQWPSLTGAQTSG